MSVLQALVLGLFQGIAEFLPISSSGHLLVFKGLMGLSTVPVLFDVMLHLATLASILVVFRKRVGGIIVSTFRLIARKSDDSDADNLAIIPPAALATVITGALGLMIDKIDLSGSPRIVAGLLLVTAAILLASTFWKGTQGYRQMRWTHGLLIGIAQGIGVFPGISRSGITISAGGASGLNRETAGEFSFLIAIPAIFGAFVLKVKDMGQLSGAMQPLPLAVAMVTAFVAGIISLLILMPIVRKGKLAWFAAYLIPAGLIGLFLL
jgi:undecaprenyl-diphosphatase